MKKFILLLTLLACAPYALAFNPIDAEPAEAYEIVPIEGDPYVEREYLGDLEDYPDMYELTTEVAMTLKIQLRQKDSRKAVPFGVIVVRQNDADGGVTEVVRKNQPLSEWKSKDEARVGMDFLENEIIEREISPGTYRIEVSTPDNKGDYMLVVGDETIRRGYFGSLAAIYKTQRHFGYTPLHLLFSSYLYYPLGIILIMYGMYASWKHQDTIRRRGQELIKRYRKN